MLSSHVPLNWAEHHKKLPPPVALPLNGPFCGLNDPARKCPFHLGKTRPVRPKTAPEPYRAEMGLQIFRAARSIFDGDGGSRAPLFAAPYSHAARRPGSPRTSHITKCNFHDFRDFCFRSATNRLPPLPLLGPLGESYVGVGGWRKVPLWPKICGVTPKANGYKTPKFAPVA